jgi:hypothetical protein
MGTFRRHLAGMKRCKPSITPENLFNEAVWSVALIPTPVLRQDCSGHTNQILTTGTAFALQQYPKRAEHDGQMKIYLLVLLMGTILASIHMTSTREQAKTAVK